MLAMPGHNNYFSPALTSQVAPLKIVLENILEQGNFNGGGIHCVTHSYYDSRT